MASTALLGLSLRTDLKGRLRHGVVLRLRGGGGRAFQDDGDLGRTRFDVDEAEIGGITVFGDPVTVNLVNVMRSAVVFMKFGHGPTGAGKVICVEGPKVFRGRSGGISGIFRG